MRCFKLHFDGGCKPNPGEGYGSFEIVGGFTLPGTKDSRWSLKKERIPFGHMASNMAEYQALCCGLEALFSETLPEGSLGKHDIYRLNVDVTLYSDSSLLVNQLNNGWKIKSAHLKPLSECARNWLRQFGHWDVKWNPRQKNVDRFGH